MPKKKETLDLISEAPKKTGDPPASKSSAKPSLSRSSVAGKAVSEAKKDALNLLDDQEEKEKRRRERTAVNREDATVFQPLGEGGGELAPPPSAEPAGDEKSDVGDAKVINIKPPIVVKEFAALMGLKPFKVIQELMELDVFANQNQSIEPEVAAKVCEKFGFVFEREKREKGAGVHKVEEVIEEPEPEPEPEKDKLELRPPIVTVMGHVDHGKTTLLDAIRNAKVADSEAGGITQHIAAHSVEHNDQMITFIDTPGHAAFTEMRARGANVTDIVILVVAATEGLMPTTLEAISHAKAAGVAIIVAVNKMDLPTANPDNVKTQLADHGLQPEDWGGETICVEVSALKGTGLDKLLEMILLQSEILELKADPKATARATVVEARLEPGRGPTGSVIVQQGKLKPGTPFICGNYWGKIKSLIGSDGKPLDKAGPSMPVEVIGFSGVPRVGDELVQMESERKAKKLSEERLDAERLGKLEKPVHSTLESFFGEMSEGQRKVLKLILKTDVAGSSEAIQKALDEIESEKISLSVIHSAAGPVTESDILLASASDAVIIGFNTKLEANAVRVAKREGVQVKLFSVIYELIDQVKDAMLGMLDPETRESSLGYATVKKVFKLASGRVAGCLVTKGKILRSGRARVLRDQQQVYDGGVQTLKRFKDDVQEVKNGLECGIRLGNFNDYEEDDVIECYQLEKIEQTL